MVAMAVVVMAMAVVVMAQVMAVMAHLLMREPVHSTNLPLSLVISMCTSQGRFRSSVP